MAERKRLRKDSFSIDKEEIVNRIKKFFDDDIQSRSYDIDARLQRYAKFRQWTEGRDWLGQESSDAAIPDMMTTSLRMQDTLHNSVMAIRPAIISRSIDKKENVEKQESVDRLIDHQVFTEQNGEKFIEEIAELFVNDGVFTVFIPWVKEKKHISDIRLFDPIPQNVSPKEYFKQLLLQEYPQGNFRVEKNSWDWIVITDDEDFSVSFFTKEDDRVEMVIKREVIIFDGPKPLVKDYEDVLYPHRAANLQIPGPSNPGGATHVILMDYPTIDEIKRLQRSGVYDLINDEDIKKLETRTLDRSHKSEAPKTQKDDFQGTNDVPSKPVVEHKSMTRLMCFDMYDIDGDGLAEDVIFWMILETKTLLKAKPLTEMYPANPPRRPLAEATFIPVKGRRQGISLLEMMEGLHDLMKQIMDQGVDAGTITNAPFGFYRASSGMKQEVIRTWPGELYPLSDPRNDIYFPTLPNSGQSYQFNMMTLLNQFEEKLTVVGDLQFGRVPAGKASALRTLGGLQTILSQGEARPERILRRLFMGLTEVWRQIHELNQHFLPKKKQFLITGFLKPGEDPYQEISDRKQIEGRFQFDFKANILNTSKFALNDALNEMIGLYISPLAIQSGIIDQGGMYKLLRDKGKALGQDPDRYIKEPTPGAGEPTILVEEAISNMIDGVMPDGIPAEGAVNHLQKLQEFAMSDNFGHLDQTGVEIFKQHFAKIIELAKREMQQQKLVENAQQLNTRQSPGQQGVDTSNPPIQNNELLDETLPSAGGGSA